MNNGNGNFGMINLDNLDKVKKEQESNNQNNQMNQNNNNNQNGYNNNPIYYNDNFQQPNNNNNNNQEEPKTSKVKENIIFVLVILVIFLIIGMFAAVILLKFGVADDLLNKKEIEVSTNDPYSYISTYTGEYTNNGKFIKIIRTDVNEIDLQYGGANDNGMFMGSTTISTVNQSELQFEASGSKYKVRFNAENISLSSISGDDTYGLNGTYALIKNGDYLSIDGMYYNNGVRLFITQLSDGYNVSVKGIVDNGNEIDEYFFTGDNDDDVIGFAGMNYVHKIVLGNNDSLIVTTENKEELTFERALEK